MCLIDLLARSGAHRNNFVDIITSLHTREARAWAFQFFVTHREYKFYIPNNNLGHYQFALTQTYTLALTQSLTPV